MPTAQEELSQKVEAFIDSIEYLFLDGFSSLPLPEQDAQVFKSLQMLVNAFGSCEYGFNLSIEKYVEYFSDETAHILPAILEAHLPRRLRWSVTAETNVAFAAYYALSLIYKKNGDTAELGKLCEKPYTNFRARYPLTNEVLARYYKRNNKYPEALVHDRDAITKLRQMGIVNHGPCISFASTICRMLDDEMRVDPEDIDLASTYIQAAIEYNPEYPKYYYLRAKLAFYTTQRFNDTDTFVTICDQALKDLEQARLLLDDQQGNYYDNTYAEYQVLTDKITAARNRRRAMNRTFRELTDEEVLRWTNRILESTDATNCAPPNPKLKEGRKYIFVSYNHKDFKPVYCDLLQLYRQQIPFQYDEGLDYGKPWDKAVKALIQSENCLGVLFYISQNTLSSAAVETECALLKAKDGSPSYLTVNLEKDTIPTDILIHYIQENSLQECQKNFHNNERIVNFLTMFNDRIKYIPRTATNSRYMEDLTIALRKQFADLVIGD